MDIKLKIFYFTLEISKEMKFLSLISNLLYVKENIRISPTDLKSTNANKVLDEKTLKLIEKYREYINKMNSCIEFVDSVRHPTGIYNLVREYALNNGKIHTRKITTNDNKIIEVEDYYEPNNPDEYVIIIIDHISLIETERDFNTGEKLNLHQSIGRLSSNYLVKLRNRFGYIPVVVQQQANQQESLENFKYNKLKPSVDGLADNKQTSRDCDVILGLFSPFRHEIPNYYNYDIRQFKDFFRSLEIINSRVGGGGVITPLYFDGAVNFFKELPPPTDIETLQNIYKIIKSY